VSGMAERAALVTGGGSGIGAATAARLVDEGVRVCIAGRRADALAASLSRLPDGAAVAVVGDVRVQSDVQRMVDTAAGLAGGRLHVLVNNAAAPINGTIESVSLEDWQRALDVNLTGPMLVTRCALPALRAAGGAAVVNVASVAALVGNPGITPYAISKAALLALTRQCAIDFGGEQIRVNAICPGWVRTEMSEEQMELLSCRIGGGREDAFRAVTEHQPLARVADPAEVADAVAFLASDAALFITGAVLPVDGGSSAIGPLWHLLDG
jgi:meso-butanediol dehydrogenase / (S,S)-butanediol dehydrogenase / diacetyl reductase